MQVQSLGGEDPLEEKTATHSSVLAWEISWREEPDGLQFMGSEKSDMTVCMHTHTMFKIDKQQGFTVYIAHGTVFNILQ